MNQVIKMIQSKKKKRKQVFNTFTITILSSEALLLLLNIRLIVMYDSKSLVCLLSDDSECWFIETVKTYSSECRLISVF